jgi:hypothetical protein
MTTALPQLHTRRNVVSPLVLCDELLSLAQQADHAGFDTTAKRLLALASSVLDNPPPALCISGR